MTRIVKSKYQINEGGKETSKSPTLISVFITLPTTSILFRILYYLRDSIMVVATFCGIMAYSENSIVKLARPSVIERSVVM